MFLLKIVFIANTFEFNLYILSVYKNFTYASNNAMSHVNDVEQIACF